MKSHIYTITDEYLGIPLTVEGEVITFTDDNCPDVIINEISYGDNPLQMWPFNDRFMDHLINRIFQVWVNEVKHA